MTLDEAIQHAEEKALGDTPCAQEHARLAAWLKELKVLREVVRTYEETTKPPIRGC